MQYFKMVIIALHSLKHDFRLYTVKQNDAPTEIGSKYLCCEVEQMIDTAKNSRCKSLRSTHQNLLSFTGMLVTLCQQQIKRRGCVVTIYLGFAMASLAGDQAKRFR